MRVARTAISKIALKACSLRISFYSVLVLVPALVGLAAGPLVVQMVLQGIYADRLKLYADGLAARTSDVVAASSRALAAVSNGGDSECSDDDLQELRYILFQEGFLRDVGRVRDGHIVCTAQWGALAQPLPLPPPQRRQPGKFDLWRAVPDLMDPRLSVDMASNGSAIVFTAPSAFRWYDAAKQGQGYSAVAMTCDGQFVFRSFGDTRGLGEQLSPEATEAGLIRPELILVEREAADDICVVAKVTDFNVMTQPVELVAGAALAGGISAGCLGFAVASRRRAARSLPQRIRRAVIEGRLSVVYQPQVRIRNRQRIGVEALARLTLGRGDAIAPEVFIAAAEQAGFIGILTRTVIRTVFTELRDTLRGDPDFHVSINLAAQDVIDDSLFGFLDAEAKRLGIAPRQVILELTERSTAHHDSLLGAIQRFRDGGYHFVIDDFGTGYSSLAYLAKLPISGIKLDRLFTKAIGRDSVSSSIARNVCVMADQLKVLLIAEGIEEQEQEDYILELNPDAIGQGWLYGRAVPVAEL